MEEEISETGITQLRSAETLNGIACQLGVRNLVAESADLPQVKDRTFNSNQEVWRSLIAEELRATAIVQLNDFWLSEWFPLSPGRFYSGRGQASRRAAQSWLLSGPDNPSAWHSFREQYGRSIPPALLNRFQSSRTRIYDPYGKTLMLDGGIGCVRLKSKSLASGEVWFMGATSEPTAHQGVPVALPDYLYQRFIDQIASSGSIRCTLTGQLRHVPSEFDPLYRTLVGIPQVYILVDQLKPSPVASAVRFVAEGAVMVEAPASHPSASGWDLADGIFAGFASFNPGVEGSVARAAAWLADTYAGELLGGTVLTDFDEQVRRFGNTVFSLEHIMGGRIPVADAERLLGKSGAQPTQIRQFIGRIEIMNGDIRETHVTNSSHVTVGDGNAQADSGGTAAVAQNSTATVSSAAENTPPTASHAMTRWTKICGIVALAATIIAVILVMFNITYIGIAGFVVAAASAIGTIIPILRNS